MLLLILLLGMTTTVFASPNIYSSKKGKFILECYDYKGTKTGEVTFNFNFAKKVSEESGNPTGVTVSIEKNKIVEPYNFDFKYVSVNRYMLNTAYNGFDITAKIKIPAYCYMKSLGNNTDGDKTGRLNFNYSDNATSSLTKDAQENEREVTFHIQVNARNLGFDIKDRGENVVPSITTPGYTITGGVARLKLQMARPKHTLTVNKDDGIESVSGGGEYYYGDSYSISATPKAGYVFTNWAFKTGENQDTSTSNPLSNVMPNHGKTYKACSRANNYNVTLYPGTGIDGTTGSGTYAYGSTVTISATPKTGYHFKNWTGTYNTSSQTYTFTMPAQDVVMTANGEANNYTLTFNANGGSVGTASATLTYGTSNYYEVSWNTPIRTEYIFLGWFTAPEGGVQVYDENGYCTNEGTYWSGNRCVYAGDYTVYAHWMGVTAKLSKLDRSGCNIITGVSPGNNVPVMIYYRGGDMNAYLNVVAEGFVDTITYEFAPELNQAPVTHAKTYQHSDDGRWNDELSFKIPNELTSSDNKYRIKVTASRGAKSEVRLFDIKIADISYQAIQDRIKVQSGSRRR